MPTILFNAGHFKSYAGVKIQIQSEIKLDAAGQNAGLSGVTAGSSVLQYSITILSQNNTVKGPRENGMGK